MLLQSQASHLQVRSVGHANKSSQGMSRAAVSQSIHAPKVTEAFLDVHYNRACEALGVNKKDVLEGELCSLPESDVASDLCKVVVRDYYNCLIGKLPNGTEPGDGDTCSIGRAAARAEARRVQAACGPS